MNLVLVIIGGGIGSGIRYLLSGFVAQRFGETFPWGTLLVNIVGSFAIGFFATLTSTDGRWPVPTAGRTFFMVGICGGFTTISSFSLETLNLARDAQWLNVGLNIIGSVVLCLIFVWLGHILAMQLKR